MGDLAAVEARLRALLEPYRDRLVEGEIYGIPMLRRPGAKAHDWFAGVQMADGYVKLNFLPMHGHPELLAGCSPALLKRRTGASVLKFSDADAALLDEELVPDLEALVARGFEVYLGRRGSR